MQIVVIAGGEDQKEFQDKEIPAGVTVQFVTTLAEAKPGAAGYFYLHDKEALLRDLTMAAKTDAPFFVKASAISLEQLPPNGASITGWPGFLFQETITVHLFQHNLEEVTKVLNELHWKFTPVII
jgi:hypothetical protein